MSLTGITGYTGFVGINLQHYLQKHNIAFETLSLRQPSIQLTNLYTVVHLAGKAHDLKAVSDPSEYYQVNFELTKNLYDEFLRSEAHKFIFISSVKASADQVEGYLTEADEPNPKTDYGKSKLMAEEYIVKQPLPAGKSYYILRPCMIHGPGNKGNLNLLYQFISKGIPYPLAAFHNRRSFLSIENLCFVIKEILEREDISTGIYQVADDESLSTNELIKIIGNAQNKKVGLWNIPKFLIQFLARMGDVLKLPLNSERLIKLTESYVVSNEKIKYVLGKDLPVKARDGIVHTIHSFKDFSPRSK